jgi:hypothetical protein
MTSVIVPKSTSREGHEIRGGARILDWGTKLERSDIYYKEKKY